MKDDKTQAVMNDFPVIGYPCLRKELWDRQGATLQVARRKCMAKSCFDVQKNDFRERSTLFRRRFISKVFVMWKMKVFV